MGKATKGPRIKNDGTEFILPEGVFIRPEDDHDDIWLNAKEDPAAFAEAGKEVRVGFYVLKEVVTIRAPVELEGKAVR